MGKLLFTFSLSVILISFIVRDCNAQPQDENNNSTDLSEREKKGKNNITLTNRSKNRIKVGLNCVENRMRSILNVIDKSWLDLSEKSYKLQSKIRVVQSSLESL